MSLLGALRPGEAYGDEIRGDLFGRGGNTELVLYIMWRCDRKDPSLSFGSLSFFMWVMYPLAFGENRKLSGVVSRRLSKVSFFDRRMTCRHSRCGDGHGELKKIGMAKEGMVKSFLFDDVKDLVMGGTL